MNKKMEHYVLVAIILLTIGLFTHKPPSLQAGVEVLV